MKIIKDFWIARDRTKAQNVLISEKISGQIEGIFKTDGLDIKIPYKQFNLFTGIDMKPGYGPEKIKIEIEIGEKILKKIDDNFIKEVSIGDVDQY
jgi:hypothetical protein